MNYFYFGASILLCLWCGTLSQTTSSGFVPLDDCNDNVEHRKFYQEACSNDTDCFEGPFAMQCEDDKCQCAENYTPAQRLVGESAVTACASAPSLFEQCNTTCQKPAVCMLYTGRGADGETRVCKCPESNYVENGQCYLNCTEDEYYESSKYKCIKKCKSNEVQINDTCFVVADLNGRCEYDGQCQTLYSECKSSVCGCKPGFQVLNSICMPQSVVCPYGEPLRKDNSFVPCQTSGSSDNSLVNNATSRSLSSSSSVSQNVKSNCPKGYFCLISTGDYNTPSKNGFCCPVRSAACPIGSPHPIASCDSSANPGPSCPWDTHFCQYPRAESSSRSSLCCPRACPVNFVEVGDKCVPEANLGFACSIKQQCIQSNTDCIAGVCKCRSSAKQVGRAPNNYCEPDCEFDEVLQGSECQKRLKLGDACTSNTSQLCPENARCSSINQCVCQCGTFALTGNICAPPPVCQPNFLHTTTIFGTGGPPAYSTPIPPIQEISNKERDRQLEDAVFCKVWGQKPPNGPKIVNQCAENQYCGQYITNMGICCLKPPPLCQSGEQPEEVSTCDPNDPLSCGLHYQCVRYLSAVDRDESRQNFTMCCSK